MSFSFGADCARTSELLPIRPPMPPARAARSPARSRPAAKSPAPSPAAAESPAPSPAAAAMSPAMVCGAIAGLIFVMIVSMSFVNTAHLLIYGASIKSWEVLAATSIATSGAGYFILRRAFGGREDARTTDKSSKKRAADRTAAAASSNSGASSSTVSGTTYKRPRGRAPNNKDTNEPYEWDKVAGQWVSGNLTLPSSKPLEEE